MGRGNRGTSTRLFCYLKLRLEVESDNLYCSLAKPRRPTPATSWAPPGKPPGQGTCIECRSLCSLSFGDKLRYIICTLQILLMSKPR